jgi:teichoic acid transport system ATP-binding protein
MNTDTAIEISHVSKRYELYKSPRDRFVQSMGLTRKKLYKELYALNDVSFRVKKGECVGIIGTNGSGKSTILKIITGVLSPSEGSVEIDGRISALLELGAGFNMEYTGLENIRMNGTMNGLSQEEIEARIPTILEFADIGDFINQPCKTYSSGMFVRLAFAVAINIDPEILIVDEALSVGDVFFQAKCYHKIQEFKNEGKTILLVSHDLGSISKYCDRVVLLNRGVKRAEGGAKEMIDLYKQILVQADGASGARTKEEGDKENAEAAAEAGKTGVKTEDRAETLTGRLMKNPKTLEYGGKEAEIIRVGVYDEDGNESDNIESNTEFTIVMDVHFNRTIKEPIFAYTIKDKQGTEITGTNTSYEDKTCPEVKAGETVRISFRQKMNLLVNHQGGAYLLSFGCTGFENGNFVVYHRLYDVLNINVMSHKYGVGFYDMNSDVTVEVTG